MMNKPIPIAKDVFWIGENDLETHLFEAIWPLPKGVCYNSYLIDDEKVALIDTVKRGFFPQFLEKIKGIMKNGKTVDYLIVNHMEPDHSGSLRVLREVFPNMKIVGNKKTVDFAKGCACLDGLHSRIEKVLCPLFPPLSASKVRALGHSFAYAL